MTEAERTLFQTTLAALGLYTGKIDGRDGPKTQAASAAIVALQGKRGGCARPISRIVIHCSATREGQDVSAATMRKWHLAQGWADIGYHHVVRLDGAIEPGRSEARAGSHVAGHNANSIGVVYVGGVATDGKTPKDTRTPTQRAALAAIVRTLKHRYPAATVCGHRDFPKVAKACPSFDVAAWLKEAGL